MTHRLLTRFTLAALLAACALFAAPPRLNADVVPVSTHPAPALASGPWVNGTPTTIAAEKGKVTVLLFWTHLCINCKHNLGYWNSWADEYKGSDVTVVSVHTPETQSEHSVVGVRRFVAERHLKFPVVVDNDAATWNAYDVQAWPTEVLIDKQGRIRYEFDGELNWQGSGEYKTVHSLIEKLRVEKS